MFARTLLKDVMSARNHKFLANSLFDYLDKVVETKSICIVSEQPNLNEGKTVYRKGDPIDPSCYPEAFWSWVAQFDTCDGLIPLSIATCQIEQFKLFNETDCETYVFVIDNYSVARTYLIVEQVDSAQVTKATEGHALDFLQIIASRWQCLRAELEANREYRQRDIKEAKYLDVIHQREEFIEDMKLVQKIAVEISNPETLDELHRFAVEAVREQLGFDRSALMLLDIKKRCFSGTYGTDEVGETTDVHHTQYDLHQLEEAYINALFEGKDSLVVLEDAPLYSDGTVIGQGWNAMLILRDNTDTIGWIALDNFINRAPITSYQKQMLESFGSLLSQIYIRKRQEQNIRMLHASMVELSRCMTVRDVCKSAVTFGINKLGIDRLAVFLTDDKCSYMQGTWGTDIQGNVVDESYYRSELVDRTIVSNARSNPNEVVFEESVPIYHDFHIVGFGWTAMTMLTSSSGESIAFIAADNLIRRSPLTHQLREVIRMFASNLTEVLLRTRAQEAVHVLNETLEMEVKARTKELQQANEQLEIMAKMDPLTRLGNRRMLESVLEAICIDSSVKEESFALILVDIDHFGLYNNCYGHMQGDIALMRVGGILQQIADQSHEDFCRIGGEEFALLVVNQDEMQVKALSERIRTSIEKEGIVHADNEERGVLTVSVGYTVTSIRRDDFNFDVLYNQADKALYTAKANGRNRILGFTEEVELIK
ncbi:GGDEF domain-containing protein [Vibrio sp. 404]|uniref:diguanylate cyclase n=1 Tax=Vibrio marinisediminis TaxID=2758441 RepID=A0A7W2FUC3_9VIBR|nr:GGDEF domain-containing protein [Vibrio marinisediminis]MBA5764386.1 GGDEF domain-containing protein [Vibrio marinisediminis]